MNGLEQIGIADLDMLQVVRECFYLPEGQSVPYWQARPVDHFLDERVSRMVNTRCALQRAGGTVRADGRRRIMFVHKGMRLSVYGYQVVWALQHGEWPESEIDHKDRDPTNDAPGNLRKATHQQNMGNTGLFAHNTSGVKGVSWAAAKGKWRAYIKKNGKNRHLGYFDEKQAAADVRRVAAAAHFGEFSFCDSGAPT
jgi:hypothetical protein